MTAAVQRRRGEDTIERLITAGELTEVKHGESQAS
jgi:hypothetical protein